MHSFEHFYIKDTESGYNGWAKIHDLLAIMQDKIQGIKILDPSSFRNREVFTYVFDCATFIQSLCAQQMVRLNDFNPRLSILINTSRSVLTMYEDECMEDMEPARCQEIKDLLIDAVDNAAERVNVKKHIIPVEKKATTAAEILEDKDPVLNTDASYDNFSDAMRLMLRRMVDDDKDNVKKLLSPQERLFFDVREQSEKTIANFSAAVEKIKVQNAGIQFARGTIALQGRLDRKGLKFIPKHHVVQMAGTAMCPGFSSRDSDIQAPTFFIHDQRFIVFNPDLVSMASFYVSDTRRDKIRKIRDAVLANPKASGYTDVLEGPLQNRLFPKFYFVWLANSEAAQKLDIKTTVKAELAF